MTALEAAARPRVREEIRAQVLTIDKVRLSDRLVVDVLRGWPARADARESILEAAQVAGVDVTTVPVHSPAEVSEWLVKRRGIASGDEGARVARLIESIEAERAENARLRDIIVDLQSAARPEPAHERASAVSVGKDAKSQETVGNELVLASAPEAVTPPPVVALHPRPAKAASGTHVTVMLGEERLLG